MAGRDDIAEILASRWAQLPEHTGGIEDRRIQDPLDLVRPPPLRGFLPYTPQEIDEFNRSPNTFGYRGAAVYPGPMPGDMGADIARFAANEAKAPAAPEQFGGPADRRDNRFQEELVGMDLMGGFDFDKGQSTDRGHLANFPLFSPRTNRGPYGKR